MATEPKDMEGEEAHTEGHQEDNSKSESLLIVTSPRVGPVAKVQRMSTWHRVTSARVCAVRLAEKASSFSMDGSGSEKCKDCETGAQIGLGAGREVRQIWRGWIKGLKSTLEGSMRPSARSCTLVTTIPHSRFGEEWLGNCLAEEDLEVLAKSQLTMIQNVPLPRKADGILACISHTVASKSRAVIVPLCSSLPRSHLKCCVQFWAPRYREDIEGLECIQRRNRSLTQRDLDVRLMGGLHHSLQLPEQGGDQPLLPGSQ
ncbi:hypothetical protein TURU_033901 [Turdus rufiventris]|nr:hypothetical protein TURU_033901 [Turdus rufiventris]